MLNLSRAVCLLALTAIPALATTIVATGTFTEDDNVALIPFSVSAVGTVTIESFGYAGGTTTPGQKIGSGGFAPNALLFDSSGNEIASDNGGHCGVTGPDPVTNNCDDPFFQESLGVGKYTLALVEWDNTTTDGFLPDGFTQDGNPGFTCAEFGQSGNFCDVTTATGTQRNGNYAVQISGVNVASPEPSTLIPVALAGILIALQRRKIQAIF